MKISGYDYSFDRLIANGQLDVVGAIRYLRELGVDAIEITDTYLNDEKIPAVKSALTEAGMAVSSYGVVCDVVTQDPAERRARVADFHRRLARAVALGAKYAGVIPGWPREGIPHSDMREWFIEALRDSVGYASGLGLKLNIPNVGWQPAVYGASDHILAFRKAVGPPLGVTYDVGNYLLVGEDSLEAMDRVAQHIVHVHFKDWEIVPANSANLDGAWPGSDSRLYRGVALGDGIVNLKGAVARLWKLDYQGYISFEYEGIGDPYVATRRGFAYLRSLLGNHAG